LPIDREATLKKAEKALRQGRIDAAIAEYAQVVEEHPRDWTTANTLGDLYLRAGQPEKAAAQYNRIAEHFTREGFYPKAAALYKKILKIRPDDESAQVQLAEASARLGLVADAKAQFGVIVNRRRARGDHKGANELIVRLGALDAADFEARLAAARVLAESGQAAAAALRFRQIADDLFERGREADAMVALRQAVKGNPKDLEGRAQLARAHLASGDVAGAREFLDAETAGDDAGLLLALAELELADERDDSARAIIERLTTLDPDQTDALVDLGWKYVQTRPTGAYVCIDAATSLAAGRGDFARAAALLQEYVARASTQVPALLKLVEVCVDGGLEATMYEAQAQLCDAYLSSGQPSEARVIAEDLVAREPWERAHIDRFRQALIMQRVSDPDSVIAERLSGQSPFLATDHFAPPPSDEPPGPVIDSREREIEEKPFGDDSFVEPGDADQPVDQPRAASTPEPEAKPKPKPEPQPETPARQPEAPSGSRSSEIDLTTALFSATKPQDPAAVEQTLAEVFRERRAREAEDAAEQLRLARAYLDTGMTDEAIDALRSAARSPRERFEAASALARLYAERRQLQDAVEWFERAAEAPAPTADAGRALLYDFGVALEDVGETARALAVFLELQADVERYRDVQARVDRLSRVQTGG
jgi:tetratricopeptide (TPR) repeat protein